MRTSSTVLLGLLPGGCVAEAGQACDGLFTNQCKSPATCVSRSKGSFCATSCSTRAIPEPGQERTYCEDASMEHVEVKLGGGAPMGRHCLPKAANSSGVCVPTRLAHEPGWLCGGPGGWRAVANVPGR